MFKRDLFEISDEEPVGAEPDERMEIDGDASLTRRPDGLDAAAPAVQSTQEHSRTETRRVRWLRAAGAVAGWAGLLLSLVALTRAEVAGPPPKREPSPVTPSSGPVVKQHTGPGERVTRRRRSRRQQSAAVSPKRPERAVTPLASLPEAAASARLEALAVVPDAPEPPRAAEPQPAVPAPIAPSTEPAPRPRPGEFDFEVRVR